MRCFVCWRYAPTGFRWPLRWVRPVATLVNERVCAGCYADCGEVPWGTAAVTTTIERAA